MKRKYFSALLMGALTIAATSTVTSCKDYDDDIQNLQQQIDANSKAIKAIEDLIKSGSVITDVTSASSGVTVTLSDGKTFTISNGKDGEDGKDGKDGVDGLKGTAWTIGDDGYWYKDGTKTSYKAIGQDGTEWTIGTDGYWYKNGQKTDTKAKGEDGTEWTIGTDGYWYKNGQKTDKKAQGEPSQDGKDGQYYYPNPGTKTFWIATTNDKVGKDSGISYLGTTTVTGNGITATLGKETLTLNGVKGVSGETVVISLTGDLRSLVFMPHLYLDGIEAYEYNWLQDTVYAAKTTDFATDFHKDINGNEVTAGSTVAAKKARMSAATNEGKPYDYSPSIKEFTVSPVWGIQYHMNPSNANTTAEDVIGYNVLNPTAIYTTRATEASADIEFASKNLAGADAFYNSNGILTAGIKVNNPAAVHKTPTDKYANDDTDVNTFALQVKTKDNAAQEPTITSDYSMLVSTRSYLKALVWSDDESHNPGGENCPAISKDVHIYDSPAKALAHAPALEMSYASATGIDLSKHVAIEYMSENLKKKYQYERGVWQYGEQLPYGLKYEFNLVYYRVDGNSTVDSRYTKWVDQSKGQIRAWNVKEDGVTEDKESATSIGREPLVQVLVKNADGEVVLDGYILIKITDKPAEDQPNTTVDLGTKDAGNFDLCNGKDVFTMNWSEFSKIILTDKMENMTKEQFEKQYEPDYVLNATGSKKSAGFNGDGNEMYYVNVYTNEKDKGIQNPETNQLGEVIYTPNYQNTTNDAFVWTLTATELENLTHHKTENVPVTRYIRYNAKTATAKYPYIYVKMTFNVGRDQIAKAYWGAKNDNYWFSETGAMDGWEAIQFDIHEPRSGVTISTYNRGIPEALQALNTGDNKAWFFTAAGSDTRLTTQPTHKYYIVPKDIVIKGQDGVDYTITAASSATDVNYAKLICKYDATDKHNFFANGQSQLNTVLNSCAIDYNAGAFNNTKLYAKHGATYTQIANLNSSTGVITLDDSKTETKTVLNAIGYMQNRENLNKEFRTYLGIVAANGCNVAEIVVDKDHESLDGTFLASWTRPINVLPHGVQQAIDAKTEGNTIYVLDFLRMYDWRGYDGTEANPDFSETDANMWGDNIWFWVYYGVNAISVDLKPENVETTMHSGTWKKLSEVTTRAELVNVKGKQNDYQTYNFWNLIQNYGKSDAATVTALRNIMKDHKAEFGAFTYYNNGDIVESFKVRIPITIHYVWGEFKTKVEVEIKNTAGHKGTN